MIKISSTSIETVSGRFVDVANPMPRDFVVSDIAWALSREPRFSGHTIHELPYTVGQHSIVVANLLRDATDPKHLLHKSLIAYFVNDADVGIVNRIKNLSHNLRWMIVKLGLLHDASEAYLRDIPSPVKSIPGLKETYAAIESKVMAAILDESGLDCVFETDDETEFACKLVHWADVYARTIEAYHLMPSRGSNWGSNQKLNIGLLHLKQFEQPKPSLEVYEEFMAYFKELP